MADAESLFPLPLVAFERYMLADDRPDYPMAFVLAMRLSGRVHREAMEESVRAALARHPLLRAVVDGAAGRRPCWVPAPDVPDPVDWGLAGAPLTCPSGEAIDLARQPGWRLWIRQGEGTAVLTAQFHHACCDGLGGLRFLGDVLAHYGLRTAPEARRPALAPLDTLRLADRGVFGRDKIGGLRRLASLAGTAVQAARFARCRPAPLRPASVEPIDLARREPFPALHWRTFDAAEVERLSEAARRQGATVNDLLLRDLFLSIAVWNGSCGGMERGWYRLLMPASLRRAEDAAMPAANVVTMSFLARPIAACEEGPGLLDGIRAETAQVKRSRRGLHFIRVLELAQAARGHMPDALIGPRCFATAVLSNLGDESRWFAAEFPHESGRVCPGDLVLEEVIGAPPLRPGTLVTIFVFRYAGRLSISLRCDSCHFSAADAEAFLTQYIDRLRRTLGEAMA